MSSKQRHPFLALARSLAMTAVLMGASTVVAEPMDGMITPFSDDGETYVAVQLDVEAGHGVQSFGWYNNDGSTALSRVALVGGSAGVPDLAEVLFSETDVYGSSDAWTQRVLSAPVASSSGEVYLVVKMPALSRSAVGVGGGPGVGYALVEQATSPGLISADLDQLPDRSHLGLPESGESLDSREVRVGGGEPCTGGGLQCPWPTHSRSGRPLAPHRRAPSGLARHGSRGARRQQRGVFRAVRSRQRDRTDALHAGAVEKR